MTLDPHTATAARSSSHCVRRAVAILVALISITGALVVTQAAPASADHRSRLWMDKTVRIGPEKELAIAKEMMGLAMTASPHCAIDYAKDRIKHPVYSTWTSLVLELAAVTPGCEVAREASLTAAWLWYYASTGQSVTVRIWSYQQDRHLNRDLCHAWIQVGGYWLFSVQFLSISGCPAPTRS